MKPKKYKQQAICPRCGAKYAFTILVGYDIFPRMCNNCGGSLRPTKHGKEISTEK